MTDSQDELRNSLDFKYGTAGHVGYASGVNSGLHINREHTKDSAYYHTIITDSGNILARGFKIGDRKRPTAPVNPNSLVYHEGASRTGLPFYGLEVNDSRSITTLQYNLFQSELTKDSAKTLDIDGDSINIIRLADINDVDLVEIRKDGSINFTGDLYKEGVKYVGAGIFTPILTPVERSDVHYVPNKVNIETFSATNPLLQGGRTGIGTDTPAYQLDVRGQDKPDGITPLGMILGVSGKLNLNSASYPLQTKAIRDASSHLGVVIDDSDKSRMIWDTEKARFRAGYFNYDGITNTNMGNFSVAFGQNTLAGGEFGFAFGDSSEAEADYSIAGGLRSRVSETSRSGIALGEGDSIDNANNAIAIGSFNTVSGANSIAIGQYGTITGQNSVILGAVASAADSNMVHADFSYVMGKGNTLASGANQSFVFGIDNRLFAGAVDNYVFGTGATLTAGTNNSTVFGKNVTIEGDFGFGINLGAGIANSLSEWAPIKATSNNFMSIQHGNVSIGTDSDLRVLAVSTGTGNLYVKGDLIYSGDFFKRTPDGNLSANNPFDDDGISITTQSAKHVGVGLNVSVPNHQFEIEGDVAAYGTFTGAAIAEHFDSVGGSTSFATYLSTVPQPSVFTYFTEKAILRAGRLKPGEHTNALMGDHSIGLGQFNRVLGDNAVVLGGISNSVKSPKGVIIGGLNSEIDSFGISSVVLGGSGTKLYNAPGSTVIGGTGVILRGANNVSIGGNVTQNYMSGSNSVFIGTGNKDSISAGIGRSSTGTMMNNFFIGHNNKVDSASENVQDTFVLGRDNTISTQNQKDLFVIGSNVKVEHGAGVSGQIILANPENAGLLGESNNTQVAIGKSFARGALDVSAGTVHFGHKTGVRLPSVDPLGNAITIPGDSFDAIIYVNDQDIRDYVKGIDPDGTPVEIIPPVAALPTSSMINLTQTNPAIAVVTGTLGNLVDGTNVKFFLPPLTQLGQFLNDSLYTVTNVAGGIGDSFELRNFNNTLTVDATKGAERSKDAGLKTLGDLDSPQAPYDPASLDYDSTQWGFSTDVPVPVLPFSSSYITIQKPNIVLPASPTFFSGTVVIDSDLIVKGTTSLQDSLEVYRDVIIGGDLSVTTGHIKSGHYIEATTFGKFGDSVTLGGDLTVAGSITGATNYVGSDSMTIGGKLSGVTNYVGSDSMTIGGDLTVAGSITGATNYVGSDSMTIGGDLTVAGSITGATNYVGSDSMTIGGDLSGVADLTTSGKVFIGDSLTVVGDVTIRGSVHWLDDTVNDSFFIGNNAHGNPMTFDSYVLRPGSAIFGAVTDMFDTDYVQQRVDSENNWRVLPDALIYNPNDKPKAVGIGLTNDQTWTGQYKTMQDGNIDPNTFQTAAYQRSTSFDKGNLSVGGTGDSIGLDVQGRINVRTNPFNMNKSMYKLGSYNGGMPPVMANGEGWPTKAWMTQSQYIDQDYIRGNLDVDFVSNLMEDDADAAIKIANMIADMMRGNLTPAAAATMTQAQQDSHSAAQQETARSTITRYIDSAFVISIWDSDYYWKHDSFNAIYIGVPANGGVQANSFKYDGNLKIAINKRGDSAQANLDVRGTGRIDGDFFTGGGLNVHGQTKLGSFRGSDINTIGNQTNESKLVSVDRGLYVGDSTHLRDGLLVLGHENTLIKTYNYTFDSDYVSLREKVTLNNTALQGQSPDAGADDSHLVFNFGNPVDHGFLQIIRTPSPTVPNQTYAVTAVSGAYVFNGGGFNNVQNPTLTLYEGGTYTFNMNAAGHPFYLTTDDGSNWTSAGYVGQYTTGEVVTGNRETGTITFTVPVGAPQLYFQCAFHSAMLGTVNTSAYGTAADPVILQKGVHYDSIGNRSLFDSAIYGLGGSYYSLSQQSAADQAKKVYVKENAFLATDDSISGFDRAIVLDSNSKPSIIIGARKINAVGTPITALNNLLDDAGDSLSYKSTAVIQNVTDPIINLTDSLGNFKGRLKNGRDFVAVNDNEIRIYRDIQILPPASYANRIGTFPVGYGENVVDSAVIELNDKFQIQDYGVSKVTSQTELFGTTNFYGNVNFGTAAMANTARPGYPHEGGILTLYDSFHVHSGIHFHGANDVYFANDLQVDSLNQIYYGTKSLRSRTTYDKTFKFKFESDGTGTATLIPESDGTAGQWRVDSSNDPGAYTTLAASITGIIHYTDVVDSNGFGRFQAIKNDSDFYIKSTLDSHIYNTMISGFTVESDAKIFYGRTLFDSNVFVYESDGIGTTLSVIESDGSYNNTITGIRHTKATYKRLALDSHLIDYISTVDVTIDSSKTLFMGPKQVSSSTSITQLYLPKVESNGGGAFINATDPGTGPVLNHWFYAGLNRVQESDGSLNGSVNFPRRGQNTGILHYMDGVNGPVIYDSDGFNHFNVVKTVTDTTSKSSLDSHVLDLVRSTDFTIEPTSKIFYGPAFTDTFIKYESDGIGGIIVDSLGASVQESDGSYPAVFGGTRTAINTSAALHFKTVTYRSSLDSYIMNTIITPPIDYDSLSFGSNLNLIQTPNLKVTGTFVTTDSARIGGTFVTTDSARIGGDLVVDKSSKIRSSEPIYTYMYESDGTGAGIKTTFPPGIYGNTYPAGQLFTRHQNLRGNEFHTFTTTAAEDNIAFKIESDGSPIFGGKTFTTPTGILHHKLKEDANGKIESDGAGNTFPIQFQPGLDSHIIRIIDSDFIGTRLETPWNIINATAGAPKKIFYDEGGAVIIGPRRFAC